MFPDGFHPYATERLPDGRTLANPLPRLSCGLKYYYTDFGMSSSFDPAVTQPFVLGNLGRDREAPELSQEVPYDAFKCDIFICGNALKQEFLQVSRRSVACNRPNEYELGVFQSRLLVAPH